MYLSLSIYIYIFIYVTIFWGWLHVRAQQQVRVQQRVRALEHVRVRQYARVQPADACRLATRVSFNHLVQLACLAGSFNFFYFYFSIFNRITPPSSIGVNRLLGSSSKPEEGRRGRQDCFKI